MAFDAIIINVNGRDSTYGVHDEMAALGEWDPGGAGTNTDYFPAIYSNDFYPGGTTGFFLGHWPDGAGGQYSAVKVNVGFIGNWVITYQEQYNLASGTPSAAPADGVILSAEDGKARLEVYEDTDERVRVGYISAGVYGIKVYDTGANVIFEASDTQQKFAGAYFSNTDIWAGNAALGNAATVAVIGDLTGTPKIALGATADSITVAGAEVGFIVTGDGYLKLYQDASNYIRYDAGGLDIKAETFVLSGGDATLSSAGTLVLGTGDDVVKLDAGDANYRIWVGDATAADADFRVTKAGVLTAAGAIIEGALTATTGELVDLSLTGTLTISGAGKIYGIDGSDYFDLSVANGLRFYNDALGDFVVDIPADGTAPTWYSGTIKEVTLEVYTSGIIRTAADPSATGGCVITPTYIRGYNSDPLKLFEVIYDGADEGDFYVGDYDNDNPGLFYDHSAGTFTVMGTLQTDVAGGQRMVISGPDNNMIWYDDTGAEIIRIDDNIEWTTPGIKIIDGLLYVDHSIHANNYFYALPFEAGVSRSTQIERDSSLFTASLSSEDETYTLEIASLGGPAAIHADASLYGTNNIAMDYIALRGATNVVAGNANTVAIGVYGWAVNVDGAAWSGYFDNGNVYIKENLGIGTASPTTDTLDAKLDIYEASDHVSAFIRTNDTSKTGNLVLRNSGGDKSWSFSIRNSGSAYRYGIYHHDGTSWTDELFTILAGGNVGIGTASPAYTLDVNSAGTNVVANFESTDPYAQIYLQDNTTSDNELVRRLGDVTNFWAGGIEHIQMKGDGEVYFPSGNVGIGTATIPHGSVGYAKFAIEGTDGSSSGPHVQFTTASDNYPLLQMLNWEHDDITIYFDAYYDGAERSSDAGSNFRIYKFDDVLSIDYDSAIAAGGVVTWNTGIAMDTSGNVGINDVSPSYKLEVNGTVHAVGAVTMASTLEVTGAVTLNSTLEVGDDITIGGLTSILVNGDSDTGIAHGGPDNWQIYAGNILAFDIVESGGQSELSTYNMVTSASSANVYVDGTTETNSFYRSTSSARYKTNIRPLEIDTYGLYYIDGPQTFESLVDYDYKGDMLTYHGPVAEEIAAIFPEMVNYNDGGLPESVMESRLSMLIIPEIQSHNWEIRSLYDRIEYLEGQVASLQEQLEQEKQLDNV